MLFKKNIFISHSSENKEIAEHLCAFMAKLGVGENNIFCSSIIGQGVNNGEKLNDAIAESINKSRVIVYILSQDFIASSYCMEELGVGWYLSQRNKVSCFYLVLPDIELSDLRGFVNSKIDKFSFLDDTHSGDLGLFAENICEKLKVKLPKHSVLINAERTFFSVTKNVISSIIEKKEKTRKEREEKEGELQKLRQEISGLHNKNADLSSRLQEKNEQRRIDLLRKELQTIKDRFLYLGVDRGISPQVFHSIYKDFWLSMVNRYLDLKEELGDDTDYMDMLLATIYSANGDLDDAYEHLKDYVRHENSQVYPSLFANVEIAVSNDMGEIIDILMEKIKREPRGIVQDSYKETVKYLLERKAKIGGEINE